VKHRRQSNTNNEWWAMLVCFWYESNKLWGAIRWSHNECLHLSILQFSLSHFCITWVMGHWKYLDFRLRLLCL